jgi:ABC-type nitrate/sulfonate/bicarbonate transport system substrate-binding protein
MKPGLESEDLKVKNKSTSIAAALIIIVAIAAGLAAWHFFGDRNGYKGDTQSITIGAISYDKNALIYLAEARNLFAANGLNVTFKDYDTGAAAVQAMVAGKVDIAAASEFIVVGRSLKDSNERLRIIASIAKTQDDYIFGRTDRGISIASELKGKRIGLTRQTAAEFYLGRFLDRQGMNIKQVEIVDINPARSVEKFSEGDLDGIVIWQPYAYRIRKQLADKIVSWSAQNGQLMYWNLVVTDAWIANHPELINRVLKSLIQAEGFLVRHPVEAKAIVKRRLGYDDALITAIWPDTQFSVSLDQSLIVAMEDEARWMVANNLVRKQEIPDYLDDYIQKSGLSEVKPGSVSIIR